MEKSLTYDDILLIPQYSEVESRSQISLVTNVTTNYKLMIPYIASCMDTICESLMSIKLMEMGGVGCLHRFMSIESQVNEVKKIVEFKNSNTWNKKIWGNNEIPVMCAVGVSDSDIERSEELVRNGANILIIDVAHGHHINVKRMVEKLKNILPSYVDIIGGNICTLQSAIDLCNWGCDGLRLGVGGGSLCTTRIQTGHGIPNITAFKDCVLGSTVPVMGDGGLRNSGDIAKALSVGCDTVMLGSIISGTDETPGEIFKGDLGKRFFKKYRGLASLETKLTYGQPGKHVEGESTYVDCKGSITPIIENLNDGLRSALSYSGSFNIEEFHYKSKYVEITNSGLIESKPHLLK